MTDHSKFSASAADQWMACPASIPLQESIPDQTSEYAAEGTAAHALAESCLMLGTDPVDCVGQTFEGVVVTGEMAEAVEEFCDLVRGILKEHPDAELSLESRIATDEFGVDFGGTVDVRIRDRKASKLWVVDYKHGVGVSVDIEQNAQLLSYAVLSHEGEDVVELIICQPRGHHWQGPVRRWEFLSGDVLPDFRLQVCSAVDRAADAEAAYHLAVAENASLEDALADHLQTGDHCRFCKALATCPVQIRQSFDAAQIDYEDEGNLNRVIELFEKRKSIKAHLDAIEKLLLNRALNGQSVSGHKLVETVGNRRWALEEKEILTKLRSWGVGKKDATTQKLKSPAQVEKMKKRFPKLVDGKLSALWEKPKNGIALVPETDGREAFNPATPEDDYADCEDVRATPAASEFADLLG